MNIDYKIHKTIDCRISISFEVVKVGSEQGKHKL